MAKIPLDEVVSGDLTPIPTDRYDVEVVSATVKTAQREGAKPTLRARCVILAPEFIEHGGKRIAVAGRKFFMRPQSVDPSSEKGLGVILDALKISRFDFSEKCPGGVDTEDWSWLVGHQFGVVLTSEEQFMTKPATQEQKDAGETIDGNNVYITDPVDGKPYSKGFDVSAWWNQVVGPALNKGDGNPMK